MSIDYYPLPVTRADLVRHFEGDDPTQAAASVSLRLFHGDAGDFTCIHLDVSQRAVLLGLVAARSP